MICAKDNACGELSLKFSCLTLSLGGVHTYVWNDLDNVHGESTVMNIMHTLPTFIIYRCVVSRVLFITSCIPVYLEADRICIITFWLDIFTFNCYILKKKTSYLQYSPYK